MSLYIHPYVHTHLPQNLNEKKSREQQLFSFEYIFCRALCEGKALYPDFIFSSDNTVNGNQFRREKGDAGASLIVGGVNNFHRDFTLNKVRAYLLIRLTNFESIL